MDAYVSKPVHTKDLVEVIERLAGPHDDRSQPATDRDAGTGFGLDGALARFEGDRELLAEVAALFRGQSSQLLTRIRDAIATQDGEAMEKAAHMLKGSAATLGSADVSEAALRLETMGREQAFAGADEALGALEVLVAGLEDQLSEIEKAPAR